MKEQEKKKAGSGARKGVQNVGTKVEKEKIGKGTKAVRSD